MIEFRFDMHPQLSGVRTSVACLNRGIQVTVTGSFSKVCTHGTAHNIVLKCSSLITPKTEPNLLTLAEWMVRYECSNVKYKAEASAEELSLYIIGKYISENFVDTCLSERTS